MAEIFALLDTGGVWACAVLLYLTRADMRALADRMANHEARIQRLETIHEKPVPAAA